ncbi:MAG: HlyC/CorC family transporter [Rhodanobacteraceae bacterium]|nr:HlyC/CorC family transporter [Xanthomonadales bacterium]MCP5476556.1 HlyC/CorC family transporter [Rhodanobacteraceae bacterium]
MPLELLLLLGLVLLNGFFALSEMAVVTSRKGRLKQQAETHRGARAALKLAEHPETFLSAVQTGITLVGILTGVFSGAAIGARISDWLSQFDPLAAYAEPLGLGIAVVGITLFSIILGELMPKRLALLAPERIAVIVAMPMLVFSRITHPFVVMLAFITRVSLRLLGAGDSNESRITEEEIRLLVAESAEQGEIEDIERNMINRALRLSDRSAESVMTPRNRIAWLNAEAPLAENLATMRTTPYASYPVMRGSDKEVLGVLTVKSLIERIGSGGQFDLFKRLEKPLFVPESTSALKLLNELGDAESRLALVVDEYGDLQGLVTRNDVMAAILGATVHQGRPDTDDAMIVSRADGSYLLDGALKIEDLRDLLELPALPGEGEHAYQTLAGMLISELGHIPKVAETYDFDDYRFEVVDLDGARVDKVLVSLLRPTPPAV